MAYKNNGCVPTPGTLQEIDQEVLTLSKEAFTTVGDFLAKAKFKQAISEAMRVVAAANKYISDCEPWKMKDDPARRDTVLNTALQVVSDANTMLTPFMPHASQKVYEALGGAGVWAAQPEMVEVSEEGNEDYPILTGDYASELATWKSLPVEPGRPLAKPAPLFSKLDESLGETGPEWAPVV